MKSFFKRLFCCHYWLPVSDRWYGSHTCWDIVYHPQRRWQCRDCGKKTVLKYMPVNPEFKPPTPGESG